MITLITVQLFPWACVIMVLYPSVPFLMSPVESVCVCAFVCVCVLELAEQCFPFLIRVAETPAAGSAEGGEGVQTCVCVYLFEGEWGGNERRNIILRRPLML